MRLAARWSRPSRSLTLRTGATMQGHLTELTSTGRFAIATDRGTAHIDTEEANQMRLELRRDNTSQWLPFDDPEMRAVIRSRADADQTDQG